MTEKLPKIATKGPIKVEVEKGKKYFFCPCGLSKNQPFCDGSHKQVLGEDVLPLMRSKLYEAEETKVVYFCGCKHSENIILCDGSHNQL